MNYYVCHVQDIPRGEKRAFTIKNVPIVVVHSQKGTFYAIYRICPHQRGDLNYGALGGLTDATQPGKEFEYIREGEILRCPWHSFSYDVTTGICLTAPERLRVKTYQVTVHEQEVFLDM